MWCYVVHIGLLCTDKNTIHTLLHKRPVFINPPNFQKTNYGGLTRVHLYSINFTRRILVTRKTVFEVCSVLRYWLPKPWTTSLEWHYTQSYQKGRFKIWRNIFAVYKLFYLAWINANSHWQIVLCIFVFIWASLCLAIFHLVVRVWLSIAVQMITGKDSSPQWWTMMWF